MSDDCGCGTTDADSRPSEGRWVRVPRRGDLANDDRRNPFAEGIDRRRLLRTSGVVGATTALAGCSGAEVGEATETTPADDVRVQQRGPNRQRDRHRVGRAGHLRVSRTTALVSSQPVLHRDRRRPRRALAQRLRRRPGIDQRTLEEVAYVETGYGPNYPNVTPDGDHLLIASGGTTGMEPEGDENHAIFRVDADRDSDTFGEVTAQIETGYVGPCDMTLGPDGDYAFVVDVADEAIRVLTVDPFETVARVGSGEPVTEGNVLPFMCTAAFDGEYLLVENGEGTLGGDPEVPREGSESLWDISDPENPEEVGKITRDDGLPGAPVTSEVSPDNEAAYLLIPGEGVGVIDLKSFEYEATLDVGGSSISASWGPNREKLYVPVQDANQVAVIDHASREVVETIGVGEAPTGAAAGTVRPESDAVSRVQASLASLGITFGEMEASWCMDDHHATTVDR